MATTHQMQDQHEDYRAFLAGKFRFSQAHGFEVGADAVHPICKPHQRDTIRWAVRKGRAALFLRFGLGKTIIQLETLRLLHEREGGRALIIAPLGVRQEFAADASLLGYTGALVPRFVRRSDEVDAPGLYITNYESVRDGRLDPTLFSAVTLDEAAVLRSYGSKTYQTFLALFDSIPFRFVATATPSPNRYKELIHYAGFLGVMDTGQALTRFFQRDSEQANHLTLYPHMEREFFLWLHSWALFVQTPGDMGYSDEGYALPPLLLDFVEVPSRSPLGTFDRWGESRLIADSAQNLAEAAEEKRESIPDRLAQLRAVLAEWAASAEPDAPFIVWCDLNAEQDAVEALLDELGISYASIHGSLDPDEAERRLLAFKAGEQQAMIGKPVMLGAGPNLQHCHRAVFLGITYKFNDFLQAIHRLHRFLQPSPVDIRAIYTEAERGVRKSLDAKWAEDEVLRARMSDVIRTYGLSTTGFEQALARTIGCARQVVRGAAYEVVNHDSVEEYRAIEADRFGLIVTSIPFGNHYEYSASYNDFGHNPDHAAFFRQMDYLTPELLRTLKPGRIAAIHVKDRIRFGNVTGDGFPTVEPFHADCIAHYRRHGFRYIGMLTVVTDVVRENNQTYRLGWTEQCKDGTKMGVGSPEYVLLFRKLPSDTSKGYADEPVVKSKAAYTRARWQLDAHAFWRASGNRLLTPDELAGYGPEVLAKLYAAHSAATVYDHADHVHIGEALEARGALPATFMCLAPASHDPAVWHDVVRMRTLNGAQTARGLTNHICPLQFDIVDRLIGRYSNPGDEVTDPFAGLGTVPLRAVELGRRGHGCELNPAYFADSLGYLRAAEAKASAVSLFDLERLADAGAAGDASQVAA